MPFLTIKNPTQTKEEEILEAYSHIDTTPRLVIDAETEDDENAPVIFKDVL
ncbi:MAG: hypothetical protein ACNFW9_05920 [Candidatus Kerfeldbacteria bacterium]